MSRTTSAKAEGLRSPLGITIGQKPPTLTPFRRVVGLSYNRLMGEVGPFVVFTEGAKH